MMAKHIANTLELPEPCDNPLIRFSIQKWLSPYWYEMIFTKKQVSTHISMG